jgi:hypothetical protein
MHGMAEVVPAADEARWDALVGSRVLDPHYLRQFAAAQAGESGAPVLIHAAGSYWSTLEVLLITDIGGGHRTARAPLYGGPWFSLSQGGGAISAATAAQREMDAALRGLGVVSEVSVLSPWLPHGDTVRRAWRAQATRPVCLASLDDPEARWATLEPTRRAEVRRAGREGTVRWRAFDGEGAGRFAAVYASAMERVGASPRWRLGHEYFTRLAAEAGEFLQMATLETPTGGAAALFLHNASRAAYLYAARWGRAPAAASAVLRSARVELGRMGVEEMLLGGGLSDAPDDSLLRFKRAFADRVTPLSVAARVFDRGAHDEAVASGQARPLPDFTVDA